MLNEVSAELELFPLQWLHSLLHSLLPYEQYPLLNNNLIRIFHLYISPNVSMY